MENLTMSNLGSQGKTNHISLESNYNTKEMAQTFGEWLLTARKQAGLTQEQLAQKAGISKPYVGTLENARPHTTTGATPQPDREKVVALAKALNKSEDDALLAAGYAPTEKQTILPPELRHIDFSLFNENELIEIANFAEFIFNKKLREKSDTPAPVHAPGTRKAVSDFLENRNKAQRERARKKAG
jgi:transcriptional regulator with XRE-family HTH domain